MDVRFLRYKGHTAFVDESYTSPLDTNAGPHASSTFYILTAYIVPILEIDQINVELRNLVSDNYWHTTSTASKSDGAQKIQAFCEWIADLPESDRIVVTVMTPISEADTTGEEAREISMRYLLDVLLLGKGDLHGLPCVSVVLFEKRPKEQDKRDNYTISHWRKQRKQEGFNADSYGILFDSPSRHQCLWVPDLISYVVRPSSRKRNPEWYETIRQKIQELRLEGTTNENSSD